ncbi:MAG: hypothetical protein AAGF23_12155 [Acidobacteriota bacterium]
MTSESAAPTEEARPGLAKVGVLIWLVVSYACLAGVVAYVVKPDGFALPGGVAVDKVAFVSIFGPIAVVAAVLSALLTAIQRRDLSRFWLFLGVSPVLWILPITGFLLVRLGAF